MRWLIDSLRARWRLRRLDRQLDGQRQATRHDLARRLGPYARRGDGLAPTMHRVPPDERAAVLDLLRRVDLGPADPEADPRETEVGRLYDLLDALERLSEPKVGTS